MSLIFPCVFALLNAGDCGCGCGVYLILKVLSNGQSWAFEVSGSGV